MAHRRYILLQALTDKMNADRQEKGYFLASYLQVTSTSQLSAVVVVVVVLFCQQHP